ncbi:glycosyltransferase family 2 protein [Desulfococcaceae bacterium HSG7]|nr:glycosyltransferase family 2 protein [Desulfococcaceae bacterium HSG7]
MHLAIIILNWNAAQETVACIQSLRSWSVISPSIYIVDNNSSDDDRALLKEHAHHCKVIYNSCNTGFAGGNNIGIQRALADGASAILLLNNDARIDEHDTAILLETLFSDADIGVVGPVLYDPSATFVLNAGGKDIGRNYISHLKTPLRPSSIYDVDYVSGTVLLARAELFQKVGLLDERYFFSGEVADFCKRVSDYGKAHKLHYRVVIVPHCRAFHNLEIASEQRERLYTYYTVRNRYLYIRKFLLPYTPFLYGFWIYKHLQHAALCFRMKRYDVTKVILKGLLHGLIGKYGPISNNSKR